jgi:hypothetical protein
MIHRWILFQQHALTNPCGESFSLASVKPKRSAKRDSGVVEEFRLVGTSVHQFLFHLSI